MCSDSSEKLNLDDLIYKGKGLWEDPHKDEPAGVLLSDQIEFYIKEFRLVAPYNPEALRPAQYTLRVGEEGYCAGNKFKIDEQNPLIIPPNGLVYIKLYEYFNIPYYMIARYSLRVEQVYRGLIVDNGLQVDPGFHGYINVPVYNFTKEPKTLTFDERLLSVEFVKTTIFSPNPQIEVEEEGEWVRSGLVNIDGYPLRLFEEKKEKLYHQKSIPGYFRNGERNESSVLSLSKGIDEFRNEIARQNETMEEFKKTSDKKIDNTRTINYFGLLGLLIALLAIMIPLVIYNNHLIAETKAKYDMLELGDKAFSEVMEKIQLLQESDEDFRKATIKNEVEIANLTKLTETLINNWEDQNEGSDSELKRLEEEIVRLRSKINELEQKSKSEE